MIMDVGTVMRLERSEDMQGAKAQIPTNTCLSGQGGSTTLVLEEEIDREKTRIAVDGSIHHFPRRVSLLHHNSRQNTKVIFGSTVRSAEKEEEHGSKRGTNNAHKQPQHSDSNALNLNI